MAYQIVETMLIAVVIFVIIHFVIGPKITVINMNCEFNNRILTLDRICIINLDDSEIEQLVNLADEAKKTNDVSIFYDYIQKKFRSVRITKSYMICVKKKEGN